jgi:predicted nucleic acid-binding protein
VPSVVSNTGPLIALATIGQFDLLRKLFGEILIPPAVRAEILDENTVNAVTAADWIIVRTAQDEIAVQLLKGELDAGEGEAIVLARELNADLLLIDDRSARRKASAIELSTIGTLGVLLLAKKRKLIPILGPLVDDLRRAGFHMSDELYEQVLDSAGEKE